MSDATRGVPGAPKQPARSDAPRPAAPSDSRGTDADPAHRAPVIGIVGGIGAGKSAVAGLLAELGCVVADSDETARAALRDPAIRATLVAWWGDAVLDDAGEVSRGAVAAIVFTDPTERRRLEALTHPWIEARRREQFTAVDPVPPAFVIDAPLLLEAGLDVQCDAIIFVEADRRTRLLRVARRGWMEGDLDKREDSQLPLDEKRSRADHVVKNNGDLSDLREKVRTVFQTIVDTLNRNRRDG